MDFNLNKEVRKVLELFAVYPVLRRMFYAALLLAAYWRLPDILAACK